jgi:glutamate carboxypeptidase
VSTLEAVAAQLSRNQAEGLERLERWVRQNSFSAEIAGVNRVVDFLAEDFGAIPGLELERVAGGGTGDHLIARTPAWNAAGEGRVLLIGHHDTVFPPGTFDVWERSGDRLRGPGTLDMKGGLLVVHAALAALASVGLLDGMPVAVVSVGDEEIGSRHSRDAVAALARGARAALVFESGRADDSIVTRRKGIGNVRVEVAGRAAHAGNNHRDGINAIYALSRFVCAAQRLTDYEAGITVNVGTFSGGETTNSVPAAARCGVDFRYVAAAQGEQVVQAMREIARDLEEESGAKFTLEGGVHRPPLERTPASTELYELYARLAIEAGLGGGEANLIGGGSDANNVSAIGVACIDGLGPRGRGFHTHDEYIEVTTLVPRAQALAAALLAMFGRA